jgi:hypothetical protein
MVAQELHETERSFVRVLEIIVNTFYKQLVDAKVVTNPALYLYVSV